jgi:hypothetical protein
VDTPVDSILHPEPDGPSALKHGTTG